MNTELVEHLIKEHSYKVDYANGSKTYELGENDVKHIAKLIVKKLTMPVVVGQSEQLVCEDSKLDCPYDFTSRCTMGRCYCEPKANQLPTT